MKRKVMMAGVACVLMALSSCEKQVIGEDGMEASETEEAEGGSARLSVITRAPGDPNENAVSEGRIYIMNSAGTCVEILSTDEESNQATTRLAAGQYTLYAIGGDDLSRFALPTKSGATANSVITRLEGKVMADLLLASASVDLGDGETVNQNIILEHKVLCMDEIAIKQVPETATKVEVSFSPLYSSIQLNGTYPDSPTESYKIALTKQADGTTWKASPQQMLFPSKGKPTIKVSITTDEGVQSFAYNATEELPANHHFKVEGTYKVAYGFSLTGILTAGGWGEDRTITFDIDNNTPIVYDPVAQTFCNGYYVVSVDASNRTAVLLAKSKLDYVVPGEGATNADWYAALTGPMAALELPPGITSGSWRLQTLAEAEIITLDTQIVSYGSNGNSGAYFCDDGDGEVKFGYTKKQGDTYTFKSGTNLNQYVLLRPVIDIHY